MNISNNKIRKSLLLTGALLLLLFSAAFTGRTILHTDEYIVDTSLSKLEWTGKKMNGQHFGIVKILQGSLYNNHGNIVAGEFDIDMKSIRNLDLKDESKRKKLETHLKSPDFFSVDSFPVSRFSISSVTPYNGPDDFTHTVTGNLTIKDITNEIVFPAKLSMSAGQINADAYFEIDRSKWNVRYGSKSFFNDIGDKAISDMIGFKVTLVAKLSH